MQEDTRSQSLPEAVEVPPAPRGPLAITPTTTPYTLPLYAGEIDHRALVIDTETTGRSVTSEIIEVAVCDMEGRILYESLVRPTHSPGAKGGGPHPQVNYSESHHRSDMG